MAAGVSPFTKPQLPCLLLAEPSWDPFALCPEETPSSHQQPPPWQCQSFQAVGSHWSPWLFVCCPDTCCPGLSGWEGAWGDGESLPQSALPARLGKSFKDSPAHFAAPEIETQDKVANPPSFRLRRERETPLLGRSEGPERRRARWKIGGGETGADRTRYPSASGLAKVEVSSTVFVLEIRGSFSCRARPLPALPLRGRGRGSPASATLQPTPSPRASPQEARLQAAASCQTRAAGRTNGPGPESGAGASGAPELPGSCPLYLGSDLVAALARLDVHDLSHAAPAAGLRRRRGRRAGGRRAAAGAAGAERLEEAAGLCRRVLSGAPAAPGLGADVTADGSANPETPLQNTAPAAASGPGRRRGGGAGFGPLGSGASTPPRVTQRGSRQALPPLSACRGLPPSCAAPPAPARARRRRACH